MVQVCELSPGVPGWFAHSYIARLTTTSHTKSNAFDLYKRRAGVGVRIFPLGNPFPPEEIYGSYNSKGLPPRKDFLGKIFPPGGGEIYWPEIPSKSIPRGILLLTISVRIFRGGGGRDFRGINLRLHRPGRLNRTEVQNQIDDVTCLNKNLAFVYSNTHTHAHTRLHNVTH